MINVRRALAYLLDTRGKILKLEIFFSWRRI